MVRPRRKEVARMGDRDAVEALVSDLHWQIDQLRPRGIKNNAGQPYYPSYYIRGLNNAAERGGLSVVEYVKRYLYKPPSDGSGSSRTPTLSI
jgi:hypothetical protein